MPREVSWSLGVRPALDGLRAVAVLLVVLAHVGMPGMPFAGQVGVTMFFTLSGFLITAILLEEARDTGSISLRRFYLRRALRLLPALVVIVGVVALLDPHGALARSIYVLAYIGNWARVAGADLGPLNHTWSLSIEEQFYLAWPLLLVGLVRALTPRALVLVILGGALASAALRFALAGEEMRIMLGADTRADALLVGCALAVMVVHGGIPTRRPWVLAASLTVLVGLGALSSYQLALPLVAPLTAAVILEALHGSAPLEIAAIRYLGRISYGVYLWHFAIVMVWREQVMALPLPLRLGGVLLSTLLLASVSYHVVERPFLRLKGRLGRVHRRGAVTVAASPVRPGAGTEAGRYPSDALQSRWHEGP